MPKVTFVKKHRPKGDDPAIPTYKAGESYELELSYAEKYKRLGLAVDYVEPAAKPEPVAGEHTESEDATDAPRTHRRPSRR